MDDEIPDLVDLREDAGDVDPSSETTTVTKVPITIVTGTNTKLHILFSCS